MSKFLKGYESFLRIKQAGTRWNILRARAIYSVALLFVAIQLVNQVSITIMYGGWTIFQTISLVVCIVLMIGIHALRWTKAFTGYAIFFTCLSLGGILAAAVPGTIGINTSMVPYVIVGPPVLGFIHGPRAAIAYAVAGFAVLLFLYVTAPDASEFIASDSPGFNATIETERFLQAVFSLILATMVAATLSGSTKKALNDLEAMADAARRAEHAKTQFLANMSHEIRTPMNGVAGMLDLIDSAGLPEETRERLGTARGATQGLIRLLNDILDHTKLETGKMTISTVAFDVSDLVCDQIRLFEPAASRKGLTISAVWPGDVPGFVLGDPTRWRQVLGNLIGNAVKFTETGAITVKVAPLLRDGEETIRVEVTDTGIGIPSALLPDLFRRFTQADASPTRTAGGTGLGLAISRQLVRLMGGRIGASSEVGEGSTFWFELPAPAAEAPVAAPRAVRAETGPLTILLAEDNPVNQKVAAAYLERLGHRVRCAGDGVEALAALGTDVPDLLLTDMQMPRLDGAGLARKVRGELGLLGLPIIAITADAMPGDRERVLSLGMDGYVSKPINPEALTAEIAAVMTARRDLHAARPAALGIKRGGPLG